MPAMVSQQPAQRGAGHQQPAEAERSHPPHNPDRGRLRSRRQVQRPHREREPDQHVTLHDEGGVGAPRRGRADGTGAPVQPALRETEQPHRDHDGEEALGRRGGQRRPVPAAEELRGAVRHTAAYPSENSSSTSTNHTCPGSVNDTSGRWPVARSIRYTSGGHSTTVNTSSGTPRRRSHPPTAAYPAHACPKMTPATSSTLRLSR